MAGFPLPLLKWREDDNNGYPLAGGKLWSYVAGTNTPQATYSDPDLAAGHQNTNPVILDASGRWNIYIQDGVGYKFVLTDALGNTIYTVDNIFVGGGGSSAAPPPPDGGGGSGPPSGQVYITAQVPVTDPPRTAPIVFPAGVLFPYVGTAAPQGPTPGTPPYDWLLCDGSPVGRSTYATLFAVIGTTYGSGNQSTTFNLPDLREKFPLGAAASGVNQQLGHTGGFIQHTHNAPAHRHPLLEHIHSMNHAHPVPFSGWGQQLNIYPNVQQNVLQCGGLNTAQETQVTQANANNTTGTLVANTGIPVRDGTWLSQTELGGGAGTDGNDPPYQVFNYLIKT